MFCFGILLGPLVINITTYVFLIGMSLLILAFAFLSDRSHRVISLALFFFIFGLFRYQQSEIPKNIPTVRDHTGSMIRIEGDVIAESSIAEKSEQVTIGYVRVAEVPVFGNVLMSVAKEQPIAYNDHLVFSCSMQIPRPFSGFAYDRYLEAKGTLAFCRFPHNLEVTPSKRFSIVGSILQFKHQIIGKMKQLFLEPHASFLFGLVFGGNVGLDKDIQNDFARTGTSHILAASGFNASLFTFVFFGWVIQYLGRKRGAMVTAILLAAYVIMAGATAAVVRAAIFGSMLLIGSTIGRRASIVNILLFTASLMLFYNPRLLLDDVGFQLSFVAFVAIIFVAPRFESHLEFVPEQFGIRDALAGSLSAIALTLPIILWQYILAIISIFASPAFASVSIPFAHVVAVMIAIGLVVGCIVYFRKS